MTDTAWTKDIITSPGELRELAGTPHEAVIKKSVATIDDHVRKYLSISPLFFLSTSGEQGRCDVSPRGDGPGFVKVLDDKHIIFPERPGNRRADSLLNILANPHVGMLCIIPGLKEVLRINGQARITRNRKLLETMQWEGKTSGYGVIVKVEECFIHCPRALNQAKVWQVESWPAAEELPSMTDMFHAHLKMNGYLLKD
ncbi:MSMEG_1061 family FMN-dependent PPOX-type flavoprotein [Paenibacillus abyssi]|uniref:Phosphohydrolase n=1 Tax=Paenibacillus abyssi TaxID=1340531 RepID=A0A917D4T3_9BACL|nr:MSMEG_1061 family FMN-dependent PPOX-type flavoprotein [Paenibacillus abyssi]GGG08380.1 phosphohydrolase [Paenibacillus abyssi]